MDKKAILQKVSNEASRFIYSNYEADEIANGKDMVMYCIGDKLLFGICIREDSFDFLLLIGKNDRAKIDALSTKLPQNVTALYDNMIKKDETWLWLPVADMVTLEALKLLILAKHEPNRQISKENAVYSKCGVRCDMCCMYMNGGKDSPEVAETQRHHNTFWGDDTDWTASCPGCFNKNSADCDKLNCAKEKGHAHCLECQEYPCCECGVMHLTLQADSSRTADTFRWAIMPYLGGLS